MTGPFPSETAQASLREAIRSGPPPVHLHLLVVLAIGLGALTPGCASTHGRDAIYQDAAHGDLAGALARIPESPADGRDALLDALDRGALLQAMGDPVASNEELLRADDLFEYRYTRSISREIAAFTLTPAALPYRGEDFERVLLHALAACNFLELGDLSGAQVEARAINTRLTAIHEQHSGDATYSEDAFARYLAGLVHEAAGDLGAAWIELRRAREVYEEDYGPRYGVATPAALPEDLLRLSSLTGRDDAAELLRAELGHGPRVLPPGTGEVVVMLGLGMAPPKVEDSVVLFTPDEIPVKVAVPHFAVGPPAWRSVRVDAGSRGAQAVLVEDVAAIATASLGDRLGREYLRAGARVAVKYLAARKARKKAGPLAGFLTGLLGAGIEEADVRSWRTLPRELRMARIVAPVGTQALEAEVTGRSGRSRRVDLGVVRVVEGQRVFRFARIGG